MVRSVGFYFSPKKNEWDGLAASLLFILVCIVCAQRVKSGCMQCPAQEVSHVAK